ncbi:MAG: cytochrome P450 [Pseudanabaenaceae cyanobacterium SKYGB_i_bin29]|nr:cytochrome P450 [Pseudanabaenaceae cyanobacterium SKYG29]MDW8422006.1 cytochrome P450 [Pseudanabaenaceae cyanobacterium SKYGB_i_bin29]
MTLPPSSPTPPLWQLWHWITDPIGYLETNFRRYGDLFSVRWQYFQPFVLVNHPDYVQKLLGADPRYFDSGVGSTIMRPLLGSYSLLLLDGEQHQRQRKLLLPPFHGDRLLSYGNVIQGIAHTLFLAYRGAQVNVRRLMQRISLATILRVVFGLRVGDRYAQVESLITEMIETVSSPLKATPIFVAWLQQPWTNWGEFLQKRSQIDQLLFAEINEKRRQQELGSDILSLLISAKDQEGKGMSDQELRDQLLTLLLAGHETTASALAWCLYLIDLHPSVKAKLLQEIKEWNGNLATIGQLTYLHAVCQETLRLYPIAILTEPRIPHQEIGLGDYTIPAGTLLFPCIYLVQRRADIYPEPTEFRPDRFLERQYTAYEYFPFGGGGRRCIGAAFALWEMKIVLLTLLREFAYRIVPDPLGRPIKPTRRGVTVAPSAYLTMEIAHKK